MITLDWHEPLHAVGSADIRTLKLHRWRRRHPLDMTDVTIPTGPSVDILQVDAAQFILDYFEPTDLFAASNHPAQLL